MAAEDAATACSVMPATVSSTSLSITLQMQQKSEWCVPASSRATLSAFLSAPPSQTSLAKAEGTSDTREHAIALYGYGSDKCSIQYAHPIDQSAMYGKHSTNVSHIYQGTKDLGTQGGIVL